MSQADFEPIYAVVEARLKTLSSLKLVGRRWRHWSEVSPADQPAAFITQRGERPQQERGRPPRWFLDLDVFLYVSVGNDMLAVPAQQLNAILSDLRLLFAPSPVTGIPVGFEGLVSHAWIGGKVEIFDGVLGAQAVAVVPLEILTA